MHVHAFELGQVRQGEGLEDVAQGVVANRDKKHHGEALEVVLEQGLEGRWLGSGFFLAQRFELWGLRNAVAHPQADAHQHDAADKRNAPAAGQQELVAVDGQQVNSQ